MHTARAVGDCDSLAQHLGLPALGGGPPCNSWTSALACARAAGRFAMMTEATESMDNVAAKRQEQQARYESVAQARSGITAQTDKMRLEAMRIINSQILDYRHEHPATLRKTIEILLKLCQNISDAPDDPKFRKVKARNAAFATSIAPNTGAIRLLSSCGWHAVTENLEKTWIFDHASDTPQMRLLSDVVTELKKALDEVTRKDQMSHSSDKKREVQARHEVALMQIEEDRRDRLERQERVRQAELASKADAAKAAEESGQQATDQPHPVQTAMAEEHLLGDAGDTKQAGNLRRRHSASADHG